MLVLIDLQRLTSLLLIFQRPDLMKHELFRSPNDRKTMGMITSWRKSTGFASFVILGHPPDSAEYN
jgi:hypothetical protein